MTSILFSLLAFTVALMILITVHEFGHFWVARKLGVKVLRFSIGFGKPLLRWQAKSGTEYVLSVFPLGGYVKMLDEREGVVAEKEKHLAFNRQSVWTRIAVVVAGPLFNILFAIAAYWLMFIIGITAVIPLIGDVKPASIADKAGLRTGEEIIAIDDTPTRHWQSVRLALLSYVGESKRVKVTVKQPQTAKIQQHYLELTNWQLDPQQPAPLSSLGITPYRPDIPAIVHKVSPEGAAEKAGLQAGDRVIKIDGQPVDDWMDFVKQVKQYPEKRLEITVVRGGGPLVLTLTPEKKVTAEGEPYGYVGLQVKSIKLPKHMLRHERYNIFYAIWPALTKTFSMVGLTFVMLWKLVIGHVSLHSVSGPVGIATGAGISASLGVATYLNFLSLISISLAVLNILPIPILDGGHLLYYLIELCSGRPVPESIQAWGIKIGLLLLVSLMMLAFYNDIMRLVG